MKPNRYINFTNLFGHEALRVSESSSVHHQEFIHCNKLLKMYRRTVRNMYSYMPKYEGWNFNSGNYLFTTDTK